MISDRAIVATDIPETRPFVNELITPMLHEESIVAALLREPLLPLGKASLLLAQRPHHALQRPDIHCITLVTDVLPGDVFFLSRACVSFSP